MSNNTASRTILVVEDRVDLRLLLADVFTGEGYKVLIAGNGHEALRALESQTVDVILTDLRMPVMDGIEATRRIRVCEGGREVKIAAVTASGASSRPAAELQVETRTKTPPGIAARLAARMPWFTLTLSGVLVTRSRA